jgi:predicted ATPase
MSTKQQKNVFLTRVVLKHYRSIAACDLRLGSLTFLVGPNGAGKSNFLDALALVSDALNNNLPQALRDRGGIQEVRRRSSGHPTHLGIRLEFQLPDDREGVFAFELAAVRDGPYEVKHEKCVVRSQVSDERAFYQVRKGEVGETTLEHPPQGMRDRLFLSVASGYEEFRELHDELAGMGFYNPSPDQMREWQPPDVGQKLLKDARNIASVLDYLARHSPKSKDKIEDYLADVVPGIVGVEKTSVQNKETLEFKQEVKGSKHPWTFTAGSMSDGTLRALGVLAALFQIGNEKRGGVPVVGVEEPEASVHPAAAEILLDALREASARRQVIVTTHSPTLLDSDNVAPDDIVAVVSKEGVTGLSRLGEESKGILRDQLFTAGELLQLDQLYPAPNIFELGPSQLKLFSDRFAE